MGPHTGFISYLVRTLGVKYYLELGTNIGYTFNEVKKFVPNCYGVEKDPKKTGSGGNMFRGTTDDFFKRNTHIMPPMDFIFIDADHSFDQVRKDLENSLKILNEGGIIALHDTDPNKELYLRRVHCNDCYKIIDYIHEYRPDLDVITFPIGYEGISLVKKRSDRRVLKCLKKQ